MKKNAEKLAMKAIAGTIVVLATMMYIPQALASVLDPDCTAEKAAKSAAAKATVGVGGRCSPAEAAKDKAKKATGIDSKNNANHAKDAVKKVVK